MYAASHRFGLAEQGTNHAIKEFARRAFGAGQEHGAAGQQPRFDEARPVVPGEAATLVLTDTQGLTGSLSLPPGALSAPSALTLRPLVVNDAWPLRFAGQGFALSLADVEARFVEPAELTLRYSRADARLISKRSELTLYRRETDGWVPAEDACPEAPAPTHDQVARELRVPICAPGEYALLGPSEHILLPLLGR